MAKIDTICEYITEGAWLEDHHHNINMDVGCDVTGVSVTPTGVILHGHEKYGDGRSAYAMNPEKHMEALNHESQTNSEGVVIYKQGTGEELKLPKHLYFEELREFEQSAKTVEELEEAVFTVLGIDVDFEKVVEIAEENGDI